MYLRRVCLGFIRWSWRCDLKKPVIAFIRLSSSRCIYLCPAEESLTSFRRRLEMRVSDRALYSDSDFLASGEIEEQRAVRYIKYLHSESTGWRAGEIYNRTLSSFPSGYKPLRWFCFYSSFFSFLPFLQSSRLDCDVKILELSKLMY